MRSGRGHKAKQRPHEAGHEANREPSKSLDACASCTGTGSEINAGALGFFSFNCLKAYLVFT
jgi:hypothetical protein